MCPKQLNEATAALNQVVEHLLREHASHYETPYLATALIAAQTALLSLREGLAEGLAPQQAADQLLDTSPPWSRLLRLDL